MFAPAGPSEAHAEFLCRMHRLHSHNSNSSKVHRHTDFLTNLCFSPPIFYRVLAASRLLLCSRFFTCKWGQFGYKTGTSFWYVVCDEHGIGGDCEYYGGNDAQLGRIDVFYLEASGSKYVPRAVLFDLGPV